MSKITRNFGLLLAILMALGSINTPIQASASSASYKIVSSVMFALPTVEVSPNLHLTLPVKIEREDTIGLEFTSHVTQTIVVSAKFKPTRGDEIKFPPQKFQFTSAHPNLGWYFIDAKPGTLTVSFSGPNLAIEEIRLRVR